MDRWIQISNRTDRPPYSRQADGFASQERPGARGDSFAYPGTGAHIPVDTNVLRGREDFNTDFTLQFYKSPYIRAEPGSSRRHLSPAPRPGWSAFVPDGRRSS